VQVLRVNGGARLAGTVDVVGAKNSVLKLMAAALLAPGRTTIGNLPAISDVTIMRALLERLGCEVGESASGAADAMADSVHITVPERPSSEAPYELVRRIRGSICVLGPLLARTGQARVAMPGGDAIGSRPLDMHMAGLTKMGADVRVEHGYVVAEAGELRGAQIWLDFPSVGATKNIVTGQCSPRARPCWTTRHASRRSSTCAGCCASWAPRSRASARPRCGSPASRD
jgi:UDP-N-acetylglucosamine 1-carboxyvinyltransferase